MSEDGGDAASSRAEDEAVAWLVRLRAPDAAREQQAFEDWYAANFQNALAFDRVLASWGKLGHAGKTPMGADRHQAAKAVATPRKKRIAVAAIMVVAVLTLVVVGGRPFGLGPQTLIPVAYASVIGEIRTITLPDGSMVTLDTNTAVRTAYTEKERRVRLVHGRARFRVMHDRRPFIVDADNHVVTATGTTFDVDLMHDKLSVAMMDGLVSVAGLQSNVAQSVASGQRVIFASAASPGQVQAVSAAERNWPSGMLSFENATLEEVVEQANDYSRTKIILADGIGKLRFTGTFRATATGELAAMLAAMFKLKQVRSTDSISLEPGER